MKSRSLSQKMRRPSRIMLVATGLLFLSACCSTIPRYTPVAPPILKHPKLPTLTKDQISRLATADRDALTILLTRERILKKHIEQQESVIKIFGEHKNERD